MLARTFLYLLGTNNEQPPSKEVRGRGSSGWVPVCTFPWRDSYRRRNPGRYRGCRDRPASAHSVGCLWLKWLLVLFLMCCCFHLLAETRHCASHRCPAQGPVWVFWQRSAGRVPGSSLTCSLHDPHRWRSDGKASFLRAARQERKGRRLGSNRLCTRLWSGKFINETFSLSSTSSV